MLETLIDILASNILYFILYLNNSSSFPPPLSRADEQKYLEKFWAGSQDARSVLIEHNLRLVAHIIKKYYSSFSEQEDLISIGTIGLIKAINTFDGNRDTRLATYAARCIENEILMYFRNQKKCSQDISMSEPIETDSDENPLTLMDIICSEDTIIDDLDLKIKREKLYGYIDSIRDNREKDIIILRYGLFGYSPMTQREVAKKLSISRSYVSRLEKKVLLKLRKKFHE